MGGKCEGEALIETGSKQAKDMREPCLGVVYPPDYDDDLNFSTISWWGASPQITTIGGVPPTPSQPATTKLGIKLNVLA